MRITAAALASLMGVGTVLAAVPAAAQEAPPGWYAFAPQGDAGPSAIGMEDWLDKPAGQHGRIVRDGEKLAYNGKPIKLWGLNLSYANCAPPKAMADKRAAFYAKMGINAVRLHKFADGSDWAGILADNSAVEYDPAGLDRMDYQIAQFKKAGIYVKLSAHFGAMKLGPEDRKYVPFLDELGKFEGNKGRIATPHSGIHYSPELQQVHILQITNLLKHRNPYTGLTYADDPAIAFIEIINEQSILFFTSMNPLKASPTLRRQAGERFSDWLKAKYGTQERLSAAWGGAQAFNGFERDGFPADGESLDKRNILPLGNPWYWDLDQLSGSQAFRRRRLLDTMQFLTETQNAFYDRYVQALRDSGYKGEVVASNWQAGRGFSHLSNLHSDWRIGTIDRHNYFGGGSAKPGEKFDNASMLRVAGMGTLSSGMQQALDRPFMLSEWIHVFPNEWGVEGPAVIGAYGMGLQGWDVSYLFQNGDSGGFSDRVGRDRWDVTAPQVLGVFPAVSRQVLRGDVRQSEVTAPLYVHAPSLSEGRLGFSDRTQQQYDVKLFDTDKVPARTLAVARVGVAFTESYRETPPFDLSAWEKDGFLVSTTGQLRWKEGRDQKLGGFFTIDTPGTQAVVGFASGQTCRLANVTIAPQSRFGAIYVSARERDATIASAKSLVVVAMARARNTGMEFAAGEDSLTTRGKAPILLEPVRASIALTGREIAAVHILDHDGRRTERTLPVQRGAFTIDGAQDRSPYYEVTLK